MTDSATLAGGSMLERTDDAEGYGAQFSIAAPRARVHEALTTISGIAGWWMTQDVSGSAATGGEFTVVWGGGTSDMVAHVEAAETGSVRWECVAKKPESEWVGTEISFELNDLGSDSTAVTFRHQGLVPTLECFEHCEAGWDQVLASLARYAAGADGEARRE
jgi:uncharacterized protein YndB with AHSA1/START domain